MLDIVKYSEIAENKVRGSLILIDLRTSSEYKEGTIPGAINIPIFSDEEREEIGKTYKNISVEKAKEIGIEKISLKLPSIYKKIRELSKEYKHLIFFCARGGMRSSSLVALLRTLDINAVKLENGYKGYRHHIVENLPKEVDKLDFIVLYGNTGTGKTDILKELKKKGMDILDLEGCANHRGSILGSVGLGKQNSQKMFESLVYDSLKNRKSHTIFVEGESKRIGRDIIPDYLFETIKKGKNIKITASIEKRIDNLLKDYVHDTDDELIESLNYMRKHLGDKNIDRYISLIKERKYKEVIKELIEKYYDPLYEHNKREYLKVFDHKDLLVVDEIIDWMSKPL